MGDLFNIAALTTNTFKKAIEVTSHNVANVATEGYHRQQAMISSNAGQITASGTAGGGGSQIQSVLRIFDQSTQEQLASSFSVKSRYEEQSKLASQVEGVVASNDESMQEFMQRFFDAAQDLANNPTSTTGRAMVLEEATSLQSHISNMAVVLRDTEDQTNNQVTDMVKEINSRLEALQAINKEIDRANNFGLAAPNDLLDQRDQNILELGQYIDVKSYYQQDGSVDLYTGSGSLPLLSSNTLTRIEAKYSDYSKEGRVEVYMTIGGTSQQVSNSFKSGELAATIDFRNKVLDKAQDDLGLAIAGLATSVNWQNYQGYDENGNAGEEIFSPLNANAIASENNYQPTASGINVEDGSNIVVSFNPVSASGSIPPYDGSAGHTQPATYGDKVADYDNAMTSIGQLTSREYVLQSDGAGGFQFLDYKTGEDLTSKAVESPAGSSRYQLEGLEFDLSNLQTTYDGDKFLVKPYQAMLRSFDVVMTDAAGIATRGQSPIDSNNDGSLLDEAPAAAAYGDNVNIANIANLQSKKVMFANASGMATETLFGAYSKMSTSIGMYINSTDIQLAAQTAVYDNAKARSESLSGVNLDEEAANLMMYQQAYQAAAQLITSTKEMFDTLIGVMN